MTGASYPKFARKSLEQNMINKAPLRHAHDDEVRTRRGESMPIPAPDINQKAALIAVSQWTFNFLPSRELLEFLWSKKVAAVCGDSMRWKPSPIMRSFDRRT
jgi:hypothetical protein